MSDVKTADARTEPAKPVLDYSETLFLPQTDFPMRAGQARRIMDPAFA